MDFRELRKRSKLPKSERQSTNKTAPTLPSQDHTPSSAASEVKTPDWPVTPELVQPTITTTATANPLTVIHEEPPLAANAKDAISETRLEILRFRLKAEYFALYLSEIEEIIKPRRITKVPRAPSWVLGIVSLRGTMVPVVDLAKRLSIGAESPTTQRIIIISHNGELCGLLVDEVKNVELIDPNSVESLPAALHESAGHFLKGLVRIGEKKEAVTKSNDSSGSSAMQITNNKDSEPDLVAMLDLAAILNPESKAA